MKIKKLNIQGFRGFNTLKSIQMHDQITLIYGENSYGKTSISEAFEWLIYGITSKVEHAETKEEYKGSYQNKHFQGVDNPFVEVIFDDNGKEIVFKRKLISDNVQKLYLGKEDEISEVKKWPFDKNVLEYARPFILQHALKNLLQTTPDTRFKKFAELLGFVVLDDIHRDIIALCTSPEKQIPAELIQKINKVNDLERRVAAIMTMQKLQQVFKKSNIEISDIEKALMVESKKIINKEINDAQVLPELLHKRQDAIGKVFTGHIKLSKINEIEKGNNEIDQKFFVNFITDSFMNDYLSLIKLETCVDILKKAEFYNLGVDLQNKIPKNCPFCGIQLDEALREHIRTKHKEAEELSINSKGLGEKKKSIVGNLKELKDKLHLFNERNFTRVDEFLLIANSIDTLKKILISKNSEYITNLVSVVNELETGRKDNKNEFSSIAAIIDQIEKSIDLSQEKNELIKNLNNAIMKYVSSSGSFIENISQKATIVSNIDQVVQHELDILAGTEEISLLIELFDNLPIIEKKIKTEGILDSLKILRKEIEQYVGNKILDGVSNEFTKDVMVWYDKIKTSGDPNIHFDGFDLERNQKGELKARRIMVKAKSYGVDLVSAVSSLSESKLNALGLCVSIATNLKNETPFNFLVIDDPIQSLDVNHEIQFIEIIKDLIVDHRKQIILLSHDKKWLENVISRCRDLNGYFYEITQYTKDGPHISEVEWSPWKERLRIVNAIIENNDAGSVKLQQAEEEIRFIVCQLTCEIYKKRKSITISPNSLNRDKVQTILTKCAIDEKVINRIVQTFNTTDDSHHNGTKYSPNRERIHQYYNWALELEKFLK